MCDLAHQARKNWELWIKRGKSGICHRLSTIFGVAELISYCSRFMTLEIGDVISTGTPLGVGMGQKLEPIYLKTGQQIRLGVEGLGEQEQKTVAFN